MKANWVRMAIMAAAISSLCACGKTDEGTAPTEAETPVQEETVSDSEATEATAEIPTETEAALEETTPDVSSYEIPAITGKDWVILSLSSHDAVNVAALWADGSTAEDTVRATLINEEGNDSGNVISRCSDSSDFGTSFTANYDIRGEFLEKAIYTIRPQACEEESAYSLNYLDYLLETRVTQISDICFHYKDFVELSGASGSFSILIYPLSEGNQREALYKSVTFHVNAADSVNFIVTIRQSELSIECSAPVSVEMECTYPDDTAEETINLGEIRQYSINFKDYENNHPSPVEE